MKRLICSISFLLVAIITQAQQTEVALPYNMPDSVKAISLITTVQVPVLKYKAKASAGITANGISLYLKAIGTKCRVYFNFPPGHDFNITEVAGIGTTAGNKDFAWDFINTAFTEYRLLLASAADSAENFTLYSGYIFLPAAQKWKLIATYKVPNQWTTLKTLSSFYTKFPKSNDYLRLTNTWCQRSNGSWKPLSADDTPAPILLPFSSVDSITQFARDSASLAYNIATGKTDVKPYREGVYYSILKEGTGKPVLVTDTVTVFYKGYLHSNGKIFDQTKEKPARFPLSRLIKGWQLGLPLCNVGGKIKLVILSGQAYSIRTRAAKIPPNSILVFEIEVVNAEAVH